MHGKAYSQMFILAPYNNAAISSAAVLDLYYLNLIITSLMTLSLVISAKTVSLLPGSPFFRGYRELTEK